MLYCFLSAITCPNRLNLFSLVLSTIDATPILRPLTLLIYLQKMQIMMDRLLSTSQYYIVLSEGRKTMTFASVRIPIRYFYFM